jgi:thiol-disulfide isomerase/thioredoxin
VAAAALVLVLMWTGSIGRAAWAQDPIFATMAIAHDTSGSEAPGFALPTSGGQTVVLSSFRGRVVFLNFWATWCPPCRLEMPAMERLHQDFKDQGLVILAVDIEESPKLVAKFMKEFRLTFPALLDADSRMSSRYGVRGLPTTVLIDRQGRSVGRAIGPRE